MAIDKNRQDFEPTLWGLIRAMATTTISPPSGGGWLLPAKDTKQLWASYEEVPSNPIVAIADASRQSGLLANGGGELTHGIVLGGLSF